LIVDIGQDLVSVVPVVDGYALRAGEQIFTVINGQQPNWILL
jgi:hypothetical protein